MQHTPSAVYHYSDTGGGNVHHNKVNAIFQAAKKDLLQVIQIEVTSNFIYYFVLFVCKIVQLTNTGQKYLIWILVLQVKNCSIVQEFEQSENLFSKHYRTLKVNFIGPAKENLNLTVCENIDLATGL